MNPPVRSHTLGDLLRRTAARLPDKPAIRCGATAWTYREFDAVVNRLANGLAAGRAGTPVRAGDRVAVLSRNSHAFAALRFALARLGAVLVPINFMLNADEVAYILEHSAARVLAVGPDMVALGRDAAARGTAVEHLVWLEGEDPAEAPAGLPTFAALLADDASAPAVELDARMLAQIIYTSGTESLPKGAMLTHEAVCWEYVSCVIEGEIAQPDTLLHALPLYHCAQLDVFLGPAIYVGASSVITGKPTPDNILALLAAHRVDSFFAPPSIWIALLRSPAFGTTDLTALRKGYYGASIMPVAVLHEMAERLPAVRLW
ncbi:MAG TPA: AMP-binding protein, partial [Burkholderiaceae bacterium]|nr:AMP-binding protein [Burkholderiaceae bacterium]